VAVFTSPNLSRLGFASRNEVRFSGTINPLGLA
jgi:hypothetical protein